MTFLILNITKMPTAISFLTDFLSYHTQEETLRSTLFLYTIFPCKGMKRQLNTKAQATVSAKKYQAAFHTLLNTIWVFLNFILDIPWLMTLIPLPDIPARKMAKTV